MARLVVRILLAALFLAAGTIHLLDPGLFRPIMPPWIPHPHACIIVSGVAELLGGFGLLMPHAGIRQAAGIGLAFLLIAVFPANVYMAVHHVRIHGFPAHEWMAWARLPVQLLLLWGVLESTKKRSV